MKRITPALAVLLLVTSGCGGSDEAPEAAAATPVTVDRVQAMDLSIRIEATGELLAVHHAEIAAEVGGRITELLAADGGAVEQDDVVLTIDPERRALFLDSARARVAETRAGVREEERDFARIKELRGRKVSSQTQLDQAETELVLARSRLAAAEADLGVAERALSDATVRAPFAGRIARRFVSRGEFVGAGDKLVELVSLDPIDVEFNLVEADSSRAALGQIVAIRVAPYPDEVFEGEVTVVAPTIDPASRTLRVKARVDNSDGRLRPGLFARIDLGVAVREQVPMIPEEAVLQRADGAVVFRSVADARVERVVIETGSHHEGLIEVLTGVRAGDHIVTRGQFRLTDGQRVSVRTTDGALVDEAIPDLADTAR